MANKKSILKGIRSLEEKIDEHLLKIRDAEEKKRWNPDIDHWKKEIETFRNEIEKRLRQLER